MEEKYRQQNIGYFYIGYEQNIVHSNILSDISPQAREAKEKK